MTPRVLVVDDERSVRWLLARLLTRSGMAVTEGEDGAVALVQARVLLPDLVVCDLEMPRMTGLELCQALRADPATRGIPILVVSGNASAQAQSALAAGCDAVLGKPCSRELLVATIRRLLRLP